VAQGRKSEGRLRSIRFRNIRAFCREDSSSTATLYALRMRQGVNATTCFGRMTFPTGQGDRRQRARTVSMSSALVPAWHRSAAGPSDSPHAPDEARRSGRSSDWIRVEESRHDSAADPPVPRYVLRRQACIQGKNSCQKSPSPREIEHFCRRRPGPPADQTSGTLRAACRVAGSSSTASLAGPESRPN